MALINQTARIVGVISTHGSVSVWTRAQGTTESHTKSELMHARFKAAWTDGGDILDYSCAVPVQRDRQRSRELKTDSIWHLECALHYSLPLKFSGYNAFIALQPEL